VLCPILQINAIDNAMHLQCKVGAIDKRQLILPTSTKTLSTVMVQVGKRVLSTRS